MIRFIVLSHKWEVTPWLEQILKARAEELEEAGSHVFIQEPEFYGKFHGDHGLSIIAAEDEELVGFANLGLGDAISSIYSEDMLGLGVSREACASFAQTLVRKRWRGRGVGKALFELRKAICYARGLRCTYFTTHPDNVSIQVIAEQIGAIEVERRRVYSANVPRILYRCDLAPALHKPSGRRRICALPSPLQPLPRLSAFFGGPEIWIKRDDQVGIGMGGNKCRMLEYIVAEAQAQGAETLLTRGSLYSNHCRQTAAFAAKLGLGCRLVLKGHPPAEHRGNHLLELLFGAQVRFSYDEDPDVVLKKEMAASQARGERPHYIQYGGANPIGASAYADALEETLLQGGWFHRVVVAASSGATQAGLIVGCAHHNISTRVQGFSVDEPATETIDRIGALAHAIADVRRAANSKQIEERIEVCDDYLGDGYAVCGEQEREAISLFARLEGILLDPVYTARAAAGMIDWIRKERIGRKERILFWHTGGLPGLFAFPGDVVVGAQGPQEIL